LNLGHGRWHFRRLRPPTLEHFPINRKRSSFILASNFIRLAWFWQTNLIGYCSRNVMAGLDPAIHALLSQDMGWKTPPPVSQNTKVFLLLFLQKKKALDPPSIPQI
jgi:hypothetical protein